MSTTKESLVNSTKNQVKPQLERWKKQLIDFSRKNQLLFFKSRPSLTIEFTEKPEEIYDKLILENKSLNFQESIEAFNTTDFGEDSLPMDPDSVEPGMTFEESFDDAAPVVNASDIDLSNALQTNKDGRSLEQTLAKLKTRSKSSLQETGVNILYLALYFLEWTDNANQQKKDDPGLAKSPLILVPVSLDRKGLNGAFSLNLIEDEIRINPTLAYKLDRDYNIDLSIFEERFEDVESLEELEELIKEIKALVNKEQPDWLVQDESCLSLFSFAKLSLYKDLEDNEKRIVNHPVIREIAGELISDDEKNQNLDLRYLVKAEEIDKKINANESKQILDADSSQEAAIYAAKAGASFVIQGPPGTGKSQTIANIIAESLAQNKKILFVSEKKSALEVVVNRLKESRLDKFCLELHNAQRKKSEIINNLRTSLEDVKSIAVESRREEYVEEINPIKEQIQKGIDSLHKLRQPINKTLYEIYGDLAQLSLKLEKKEALDLDFTIPSIEKLDLKTLSDLDFFFKSLATQSEILNNYESFAWRGANVQNLSFELENEIKSNFIEFKNILQKLPGYANPISVKYFNREVKNIREFIWLAEASNLTMNSPFPKKDWFNPNKLNEVQTLCIEAKIEHEEYAVQKDKLLGNYSEGFMQLDHQELLTKFTQKFTGIFRFLNIDYWKTMGQIKQLSLYNEARNLENIIGDLEQAALLDKQAHELQKESTELSLVLGDFYSEFDTDWEETITAIKWVQKVLNKFDNNNLPTSLVDIVSDTGSNDEFNTFQEQAGDIAQAYELLKYHMNFYKSIFNRPNVDLENLSFDDLALHLEDLITNITQIEDWIEFRSLETQAKNLGMGQFIDALIKSPVEDFDSDLIKDIFLRKLYQLWVDKIEIENPEMRRFSGEAQQLLIDKFNDLDHKYIERNKKSISKQLSLNWIEYAANQLNKLDMQVINHEINKKKKHKPIRLLIQEVPELLQTLKPCWMMSPLSVSQLIDASKKDKDFKFVDFDLVIFDEASQIRTEDAICSIYRGKQLILAGDSNQLPPTNFFNYIEDDDDYENNNFESVLDECAVFLDSTTLNWHYRSRHEDLIKFSNYHIYDNQLITFPSPIGKSEDFGIEFELIDKGYYEKGSRFNRKEAQRVAEAILEHYSSKKNLSLGVIAFSEAQQFAIERELSKLMRKDPEMDTSFLDDENPDSLFIKNLENVQGDERDVIYFSIGYARDKKGNLSHNFGPLNRDGGHRRLNVAVTRARTKLKVFSSIVGSDIDLNRTNAQGAILLKKYLSFAEAQGNLIKASEEEEIVDHSASAELILVEQQNSAANEEITNDKAQIEESIAKSLEQRGYQVERFLGSSEFRIDIAVRNKKNPDEFILAIETDGEIYRKAKTCRDRERLRKQALRSLGWKTHKIWARDWIKNKDLELNRLLELI